MAAPNVEKYVIFRTVKPDRRFDEPLRDAVDAAVRSHGGHGVWRSSARAGRSYGLLEFADATSAAAAAVEAGACGATIDDCAVIALAVFPEVPEALPHLLDALAGAGRPAGIRSCEPCSNGGLVVEWDLERSPAGVVLGAIDVELRRFNSGRTAELLTPLSPQSIARIAADGLQSPELTSDRVLEVLLERAGLHV